MRTSLDIPVERIEGMGIVPHVRANAGTAWVSCFLVSGRIEAHAFTVDEMFELPTLYIAVILERGRWLRDEAARWSALPPEPERRQGDRALSEQQ